MPGLTARALHPTTASRPPCVTELLRIDGSGRHAVQRTLTAADRAELERHWKTCKLSPVTRPMTADEWVPYLVAFNEAPSRPARAGWVFAVMPPRDPNFVAELAWTVAQQEHEVFLRKAIALRSVVARFPGVMTAVSSGVHLSRVVLTRGELVKFCEMLCIEVMTDAAAPATALDSQPAPILPLPSGLTYWCAALHLHINRLDQTCPPMANARQAIDYLKRIGDPRLAQKPGATQETLHWQNNAGDPKVVSAKTVGNALPRARAWARRQR